VDPLASFRPKATFLAKMLRSERMLRGKDNRYTRPSDAGNGLAFRDRKPDFRMVLQKCLLAALTVSDGECPELHRPHPANRAKVEQDPSFTKRLTEGIGDNNVWIRTTWNLGCDLLDRLDCQETVTPKRRRSAVEGI
jgi:hypothetical protein